MRGQYFFSREQIGSHLSSLLDEMQRFAQPHKALLRNWASQLTLLRSFTNPHEPISSANSDSLHTAIGTFQSTLEDWAHNKTIFTDLAYASLITALRNLYNILNQPVSIITPTVPSLQGLSSSQYKPPVINFTLSTYSSSLLLSLASKPTELPSPILQPLPESLTTRHQDTRQGLLSLVASIRESLTTPSSNAPYFDRADIHFIIGSLAILAREVPKDILVTSANLAAPNVPPVSLELRLLSFVDTLSSLDNQNPRPWFSSSFANELIKSLEHYAYCIAPAANEPPPEPSPALPSPITLESLD